MGGEPTCTQFARKEQANGGEDKPEADPVQLLGAFAD
jgi:hypothetical protein